MTNSHVTEQEKNQPMIPSEVLELLSKGGAAWNAKDYRTAKNNAAEALTLSQQLGNIHGELGSLHLLANIAFNECDDKKSRDLHERILARSFEIGYLDGAASSLANLALIDIVENDLETARNKYHQALELYEKSGSHEWAERIRSILSKDQLETVLEGINRICK